MRSFNKHLIRLGSLFIITVIAITISLGFYLNYNLNNSASEHKQTENTVKNNRLFFINDDKNKITATTINLQAKIKRDDVLYSLSNHNVISSLDLLEFDDLKIKNNLLNLISSAISKNDRFKNIDDYYINVRYFLNQTKTILQLDIRWGLYASILTNKKMQFYCSDLKIRLK